MARYINTPKTSLKGINSELVKIEDAFKDVLDRQGEDPNYMDTDLDMNSHRILNLPEPVYSQEPVRLGDVKAFIDDTQTARDAAIEAAENALASEEAASDEADRAEAAADVGASYLRSVQSIEDLKSLKVDSSLVGMRIRIKEYHAGTGYGGGEWEIVTGEAANEIDIIASDFNASLQFELCKKNTVFLDRFGAKWDFSTDNSAIYQRALDYLGLVGGGELVIPWFIGADSPAIKETVYQPSATKIKGLGDTLAKIKALPDFSGTSMIKSYDFDSLTGTGKWLVADGVKYGLGFDQITLDGQDQNIKGVEYFAKRLMIGTLYIENCLAGGWYSEAGSVTGQDDINDMPESKVDYISVRSCGGTSIDIYGPHDSVFKSLFSRGPVSKAGTIGVNFGADATRSGNCDTGVIHVYGHEKGIYVQEDIDQVKGELWISESCNLEALTIDASNAQVSKIELYKNNVSDVEEAYNLVVNGDRNQLDNIRVNDTRGGGCIKVTGDRNTLAFSCDGANNAPPSSGAVTVDGNNNTLNGRVFRVAGDALQTNPTPGLTGNDFDMQFENCDVAWNNVTEGRNDTYKIKVDLLTGQSAFTGVRPEAGFRNVQVIGEVNTTDVIYPQSVASSDSIDLTLNTLQIINIPHSAPFQPRPQDVSINMRRGTTVDDYEVSLIEVAATTATTVQVRVKLSTTSATPGAKAGLVCSIG